MNQLFFSLLYLDGSFYLLILIYYPYTERNRRIVLLKVRITFVVVVFDSVFKKLAEVAKNTNVDNTAVVSNYFVQGQTVASVWERAKLFASKYWHPIGMSVPKKVLFL